MGKHIYTFDNFKVNEGSGLEFSYRGTELPTEEMIRWYQQNTQHMDNWDELDRDPEMDIVKKDFFDTFQDELRDLSYFQMEDVFDKVVSG
jgi:hypothetical protein